MKLATCMQKVDGVKNFSRLRISLCVSGGASSCMGKRSEYHWLSFIKKRKRISLTFFFFFFSFLLAISFSFFVFSSILLFVFTELLHFPSFILCLLLLFFFQKNVKRRDKFFCPKSWFWPRRLTKATYLHWILFMR